MPVGGMIDLHTHTSASDGTMSPSELVAHAAEIGLAAISITDHDTVDGLEEGQAAGDELGVIVVPGLELSTEYGGASLHLLGYFVDPDHNQLAERLLWLREQRRLRVPKMLKSLAALGCLVTEEEVRLKAANGVVGRPHVALAMVDRGHVSSTKEAFDEYLDSSAPAYVPKSKLSMPDAVSAIVEAGGVAVMAHPGLRNDEDLDECIDELVACGVEGLECFYPIHSPEQVADYLAKAEVRSLVPTGGSDFHSTTKQSLRLGSGIDNNLEIEFSVLDMLADRAGVDLQPSNRR